MSDNLANALIDLIQRLNELAQNDAVLRKRLHHVARAVVDFAKEDLSSTEPAEESQDAPEPIPLDLPERLYGNLGSGSGEEEPRHDEGNGALNKPFTVSIDEFPLIVQRCRLKAEGARWAIERNRLIDQNRDFRTEVEPRDRAIIDQAKELPDCFLWMNNPNVPIAADPELLDDVAGCFDTVATGVETIMTMLQQHDDHSDSFHRGLELIAEAQSALRAAVERVDALPDKDQQRVFTWLRNATAERKVYIPRYMRADDKADPTNWEAIHQRFQELREGYGTKSQQKQDRKALLNRIEYHVQRIRNRPEDDHDHDWERIVTSVNELLEDGMPPSSPELRGLIVPIIDQLPEEQSLSNGFRLVLREIDRFLSELPATGDSAFATIQTEEVTKAASLLEGKCLVMIGGNCRPGAKEALERAFYLDELHWIETTEHQSIEEFKPYIARPEVVMVLLAIRWSSHSYGEVKTFCEQYGKPLVRLPAGYSPNQVAAQILRQSSEQLQSES